MHYDRPIAKSTSLSSVAMKISAVIPAYNSAKFIEDAVRSVQAQTVPVDEIIIIDDGSTDNTAEIVAGLPGNIIFHKQTNQGPSAARNKGIELASGDWIALIDADDQWTPNKTSSQLRALKENPSLHFIFGDESEVDPDGNVLTQSSLGKHNLLDSLKNISGHPIPNALAALVNKNFVPTSSAFFRRDTAMKAGLFNTEIRFGEDLELWAKFAANYPIACVTDALILRRKHSESATTATERMLSELPKVMKSIRLNTMQKLLTQKVDPDKMVSDSYWTLGYWYFSNNEYDKASTAFRQAINEKFSIRSLLYMIACFLPLPIIKLIRKLKQAFKKED